MAQLCALRTHDVRALFSLERLSSAALFQETMVCSLGNKKKKNPAQNAVSPTFAPASLLNAARRPLAQLESLQHKHTDIINAWSISASHFPGTGFSSAATVFVLFFLSFIFSISVGDERQHVNTGRGNNM